MSRTSRNELNGVEALRYIQANLRKGRVFPDQWKTEYEDPRTGEKWLLDYPQSDLHGGGPPRLRRIERK